MSRFRVLFFTCLLFLVTSCATQSYLGVKQSELTSKVCTISTEQCFFARNGTSLQGRKWEVRGSYNLEKTDAGTHRLSGSAKLEYEHPAIKKVTFLDLVFVLFEDGVVVHEEKVRLRGPISEYLKFSRTIESDLDFESSEWVWFDWRATE